MWNIIIPIITLIIGLAGGFFISTFYIKHQMKNMKMDNKQIMDMARSMGVNLSQKQLNMVSKKMSQPNALNKNKKKA